MALDYEVKVEELQLKQTSDLETTLIEEEQQQPLPSQDLLSLVEPEVVRIPPDPTALMAWVDDVALDQRQQPERVEDQLVERVHDVLADDAMAELAQDHAMELDAAQERTGVIADFIPNTQRDYETDVPDPGDDYFVASANRPFLDEDSLFNGGGGGGGGAPPKPPSDQPEGDGDDDGDVPSESTPAKPERKTEKPNEPARANRDAPAVKPSKSGQEKDRK
jgi:hypothetical protein